MTKRLLLECFVIEIGHVNITIFKLTSSINRKGFISINGG